MYPQIVGPGYVQDINYKTDPNSNRKDSQPDIKHIRSSKLCGKVIMKNIDGAIVQ